MAKFKKINFKSKSLWKKIGLGVLAGVVLIGAVFGVTALFRKAEEETQKEINPTYAIGGLTEQGAYLETKESIYTKDAFSCYGLKITPDFMSTVKYQIYFYDKDNSFIESTALTGNKFDSKDTLMPENTKYARIVITPNDDSKISWFEINKYAKQIKIEINKEQGKVAGVFVPKNVLSLPSTLVGKEYKGSLSVFEVVSNLRCSEIINVSGYTKITLLVSATDNNTRVRFAKSLDDTELTLYALANGSMVSPTTSTDNYIRYDIDIPNGCIYCAVTVSQSGVETFAPIVYLS